MGIVLKQFNNYNDAKKYFDKLVLKHEIDNVIERLEKRLKDETLIQKFISGYERLALLSKSFSNLELDNLFDLAKQINEFKQFNISLPQEIDRLEQVIFTDSIAHNLHKQKTSEGKSLYKQLDELADISKMAGENNRQDRLLILQSPLANKNRIEELSGIKIFQKGILEKSQSFWRLFEKAIKIGIEKLSNRELVTLREWIFSRI